MTDYLKLLSDDWFLREPAFFALFCQQQLQENARIDCAVRCGQGKLEYNPLLLAHKNYAEFEQLMRIELIRLFLKHPYEREPEGCSREAMAIGSNITIADGYCTLLHEKLPLQEPGFYHLPLGQYYEWYSKKIQEQMNDADGDRQKPDVTATPDTHPQPKSDSSLQHQTHQENSDLSALWREDSLQRQRINELIERTTDWGTLPSDIVEKIKASTQARISPRLIWQGFRSAVLHSQRMLTRMRPNRRTGFLQMGNTRQYSTRLLVGIDVSGSVTTAMLEDFYSAVNRLFRGGHTQIDVCPFDAALGPIRTLTAAKTLVEVVGRGGTSFQPLIDLVATQKDYDGLLILTDGQAPAPQLPPHFLTPILWVCHDRESYNLHHEWMQVSGRCTHL